MILAALIWFTSFGDGTNVSFGTPQAAAWLVSQPVIAATGCTNNAGAIAKKFSAQETNGWPVVVRMKPTMTLTAAPSDYSSISLAWSSPYRVLSFAASRVSSTAPRCLAVLQVSGPEARLIGVAYASATGWRAYRFPLDMIPGDTTNDTQLVIGWMPCVGADTNGLWRLDNLKLETE